MNLLLSYGAAADRRASDKGYKFLGVGEDIDGIEVHIFEMQTLEEANAPEAKLTEEDRNMIAYFHQSKVDITRWSDWDRVKVMVQREYPQLLAAMESLTTTSRTLDNIVTRIGDES